MHKHIATIPLRFNSVTVSTAEDPPRAILAAVDRDGTGFSHALSRSELEELLAALREAAKLLA